MDNNNNNLSPFAGGTKYKGVRLRKWGKWVAEIRLPNSRDRIWLGSYDSQEKAARAFDVALFCLRGPHAKFNFPDQPPPDILDAHSLTAHQIQQLAAKFANDYHSSSSRSTTTDQNDAVVVDRVDPPPPPATLDPCGNSVSSSSSASFKDEHYYMDWSFLDSLDAIDELRGGCSNSNLFQDHFDNYILTNDDHHNYYDAVSSHDDDSFSHQPFLWNFDNH